jgi:hypothetical protein
VKARVIPTAEQFIGWVAEATKQNDGPWVEAIQRVTGNKKGDPWCASFVVFCLDIAYGGPAKTPVRRTASCTLMLEAAKASGTLATTPEVGDVFLMLRENQTVAYHTGFVSGVGPSSFKTIEGNTNEGGSRDGWGVFARERRRGPLTVFIRLPK